MVCLQAGHKLHLSATPSLRLCSCNMAWLKRLHQQRGPLEVVVDLVGCGGAGVEGGEESRDWVAMSLSEFLETCEKEEEVEEQQIMRSKSLSLIQ